MAWFNQLPSGTIEGFEQLSQRFLHHCAINKRYPKTASYLFMIIQRENENLREYVQRFSEAVLEVPHVSPELLARISDDERVAPTKIDGNKRERRQSDLTQYTPLNAPRAEILSVAKQQGLVRWPFPMKDNPKRMTSDKYCHFHRDHGHSTEECYHLKNEIEKLICRGYLREFVEQGKAKAQEPVAEPRHVAPRIELGGRTREEQVKKENLPTIGIIGVISGGPASGDSMQARKATSEITFSDQDLEGHLPANNDAIVISATVSNFWVKKILIDSGSSADIFFHGAFAQMGIDSKKLTPVNTPLTSFSGDIVEPLGEISLPVSLGSYPRRATKFIKFLVVDSPSAYNMILGRPSLNMFQAIASTYHLKIKFPTRDEIGEEIGDRRQARECYASILKNPGDAPRLKTERQKRLLQMILGKHQEETPKKKRKTNPQRKTKEEKLNKNACKPLKK
ncbi:UNVERIFIED_CONTAM: hypothetical protein Slati_2723200 [Sesamum latifolium]|uniref:Retrotransposon gag domain-containing protein n=1 Tax=Sesamum latifolium TaxID=2727402 RepID=A0AAW2VY17_9LAMI